jgi:hypothetical protein
MSIASMVISTRGQYQPRHVPDNAVVVMHQFQLIYATEGRKGGDRNKDLVWRAASLYIYFLAAFDCFPLSLPLNLPTFSVHGVSLP